MEFIDFTYVVVFGVVILVAAIGFIAWLLDRLYWLDFEIRSTKRLLYDHEKGRPLPLPYDDGKR